MSVTFEKRLAEWGIWFHENNPRLGIVDQEKRWEFVVRALDGCIELLALAAADLQRLEGRNGSEHRGRLLVPTGVQIRGDLRRLG